MASHHPIADEYVAHMQYQNAQHTRNPSSPSLSGRQQQQQVVSGEYIPPLESPPERMHSGYPSDSKFNLLASESPIPGGSRSESRLDAYGEEVKGGRKSPSKPKLEVVERQSITGTRKRWMFLVWLLTFWMPSPIIRLIVGTKRKDIQQAWREKLAINMMIWFSCLGVMFFMSKFLESKRVEEFEN
jgi:hypothetical protein